MKPEVSPISSDARNIAGLGDMFLGTDGLLKDARTHAYMHEHTQPFYSPFPALPKEAGTKRNLLLDFMVQGEISDADTPTIWLGATPSGLISVPSEGGASPK